MRRTRKKARGRRSSTARDVATVLAAARAAARLAQHRAPACAQTAQPASVHRAAAAATKPSPTSMPGSAVAASRTTGAMAARTQARAACELLCMCSAACVCVRLAHSHAPRGWQCARAPAAMLTTMRTPAPSPILLADACATFYSQRQHNPEQPRPRQPARAYPPTSTSWAKYFSTAAPASSPAHAHAASGVPLLRTTQLACRAGQPCARRAQSRPLLHAGGWVGGRYFG